MNDINPLLTLVLGSLLGFLAGIRLEYIKKKINKPAPLIKIYKDVTKSTGEQSSTVHINLTVVNDGTARARIEKVILDDLVATEVDPFFHLSDNKALQKCKGDLIEAGRILKPDNEDVAKLEARIVYPGEPPDPIKIAVFISDAKPIIEWVPLKGFQASPPPKINLKVIDKPIEDDGIDS